MGRCVRPWPFGGKATNCATCSRTIGRKVSPPVALTARRPSGLTGSAGSIFGCRSKLLSDRKFAIDDAFLPAALTASPITDEEFVAFCNEVPGLFFKMTAIWGNPISDVAGNAQLDFCPSSNFAPNVELSADLSDALAHAPQPPVPIASRVQ